MDQTKEIDIDLKRVFYMMRKKIIYIILITLFGGLLSGCVTEIFIEPTYTASIRMYVYSDTDQISTQSSITLNDYMSSTALVSTYLVVLSSDAVLDRVAADLNIEGGALAIRRCISATQVEESIVFQVAVTTTNPEYSQAIANAIADVAPDEISRIIKAGGASVIDYAKLPTNPSSPNLKRNIMIGLAAGFAISFVLFFIKEIFNTTIMSIKDIEREFDIPVLGTIPRLIPISDKITDPAMENISELSTDETTATAGSLEPPAQSTQGGEQDV